MNPAFRERYFKSGKEAVAFCKRNDHKILSYRVSRHGWIDCEYLHKGGFRGSTPSLIKMMKSQVRKAGRKKR